ncbi:MAG: hypothetical protein KIT16_20000, partial [Rhodospirillaceae bacterium]|nr:hypothetical protein [Rhodospirillaceae bacterium]
MRLYRAACRLPGAKSYTAKFFVVSFVGTHIPLLGGLGYLFVTSDLPWSEIWPFLVVLVVATVAGTVVTLGGIYGLLAPVRAGSRGIHAYLAERRVPALPTGFRDEGGRLMADVQEGITRLDAALDAAERQRDAALHETKRKFEILSRMSHELRTPLNSVLGFSKLLSEHENRRLSDDDIVEYASLVQDAATHLLTVINNILDISKLHSGSFILDPSDVQVADAIDDSLTNFSRAITESGLNIT